MGRRRKSAEERELIGDPGHKTKAQKTAAASTSVSVDVAPIGNAPDWLSPAAKKVWAMAAPTLEQIRLLGAPDRIAFARYCGWLSVYFDLNKGAKLKAVETTKSKAVKMTRLDKNFQALLLLDKRLLEYEDRFGMNPDARQSIFARLAAGFGTPTDPPAPGASAEKGETAKGPIGILSGGPHRLQ